MLLMPINKDKAAHAAYMRKYSKTYCKTAVFKAIQDRYKRSERGQEVNRRSHLRRKYGITLEEYTALVEAQGGLCAVCCQPLDPKMEALDHDHVTGKIRGVLHRTCNVALGVFQDSPIILQNAIDYLQAH